MTLQQQIRANRWRTIWLLFLFALLVIGLGLLLSFVFDPTILTFVAIGGIAYALHLLVRGRPHGRRHNRRAEDREAGQPLPLPPARERGHRRRARADTRAAADPGRRAQCVRRRPQPQARLRGRDDRARGIDGRARAGGGARPRGLAHTQPRRPPDDPRRATRGRDRTARRHPAPHGVLRRQQARLEPDHHDHRVRRAAARANRGRRHPARGVAAPRVPGGCVCRRDHERRRGHGARVAEASARPARDA